VLDSSGEGDKLLDSNEIMELSNETDGVDEPATRTGWSELGYLYCYLVALYG